MGRGLILAGIVGGIIAFAWGLFSWMVMPWHKLTVEKFKNDDIVAQVIKENAPTNGVYILPNLYHYGNMPMSQKQIEVEDRLVTEGPFVFAAVSLQGRDVHSFSPFLGSIVIQIIGALFTAWLLLHSRAFKYARRVLFVTVVGMLVGFLSYMPAWNWWGLPSAYSIIGIVDLVIAWFLAGLAMAKLAYKN